MSMWTYITGVIEVEPMGRTQAEKLYIIQTVLEHLPVVCGSEGELNYHINQEKGYDEFSSCDEFSENSNNLRDHYGQKSKDGALEIQDHYLITLEGHFRDREFNETVQNFMPWLTRLAKRLTVSDISINIHGYDGKLIISDPNPYYEMNEYPSWVSDDHKPCWAEYLMWDSGKNMYPLALSAKYNFDDRDVEEFNRRKKWRES